MDSYSGFGDAHEHVHEKTELDEVLRRHGVTDVFVAGLALDYCVAYTCKDAAKAGFNVFCVVDACRGIAKETMDKEMDAMRALGVHVLQSHAEVPTREWEEKHAASGAAAGSKATTPTSASASAAAASTTGGGAAATAASGLRSPLAASTSFRGLDSEKRMGHGRPSVGTAAEVLDASTGTGTGKAVAAAPAPAAST